MDLVEARKKAKEQKEKLDSEPKPQESPAAKPEKAGAQIPARKKPEKAAAGKKLAKPKKKPEAKSAEKAGLKTEAAAAKPAVPAIPEPEPRKTAAHEDIFTDTSFGEDLPAVGEMEKELVLEEGKEEPKAASPAKPPEVMDMMKEITEEMAQAAEAESEKQEKAAAKEGGGEADKDFYELVVDDLVQFGYGQVEKEANLTELLSFRLGQEIYAIPLIRIQQIIKSRPVTLVPGAPSYILGIISLRGMVMPVFDLRRRIGLPSAEPTRQTRIIVIKLSEEMVAGVLVDQVMEVARVPADSIEPTPAVFSGIEGEFLEGIARHKNQMLIVLNLSQVVLERKENGAVSENG